MTSLTSNESRVRESNLVLEGSIAFSLSTVPEEECLDLRAVSAVVTYGWGMIPVTAQIGKTKWRTSLFPKNERYIVPVKATVRAAEGLKEGDMVLVRLVVDA